MPKPLHAREALAQLGFTWDESAWEDGRGPNWDKTLDLFLNHANHKLTAQMTGGADWSSSYVWLVPKRSAERLGLAHQGSVFLILDEGDMNDRFVFIDRVDDEDSGDSEVEEIRYATVEDLVYLIGRR